MAAPTNLPSISAVIAEFRRAPGESPWPPSSGLLGLLLGLHHNNVVQWSREDAARRDDAKDRAVAAAKRDIDALNAKRHELVEAIDEALAAGLDQDPAAPPTTESPAMVFDRLSVLVIRTCFTEEAASSQRAGRDLYAARLPLLHQQLAVLQEGLEALFEDVRTGRKRFLPYQSLKLYGSDAPGDMGELS
jgi:hypothetical protein